MNSEDGQAFTLFVYCNFQITAFSVGITKLNQRIIWKDDIEFVTEFLCLLGHPVVTN